MILDELSFFSRPMKLPAASCGVSKRNCAVAKPAFALETITSELSSKLSGLGYLNRVLSIVPQKRGAFRSGCDGIERLGVGGFATGLWIKLY